MLTAIVSLVLAGQFGGSALDNALVDGDKVHLFLPPVVVSEGRVHGHAWSDDGRYLLLVTESATIPPQEVRKYFETGTRATATPSMNLDVFNSATGTVKNLWRLEGTSGVVASIFFFKDSDVAIAQVHLQGEARVLRVTCGTSRAEVIEGIEGQPTQMPSLLPDPLGRYMASQTYDPPTIRFIAPQGRLLPRRPVPIANFGVWSKKGEYLLARTREEFFSIDPETGDATTIAGKSDFHYLEERKVAFIANNSIMPIPGRKKPVNVIRATLGERSIGVAFDARLLESSNSGVLFGSGFVNMVRPIIQISKEAFDEITAKEERTEIMARLNQIGKAMMMYAADNDDAFPTKEQLADRAIDGYLGDPSVLHGFEYHGRTAFGESPARTEAGYMLCPGGRAILYQDGHVSFVPDR